MSVSFLLTYPVYIPLGSGSWLSPAWPLLPLLLLLPPILLDLLCLTLRSSSSSSAPWTPLRVASSPLLDPLLNAVACVPALCRIFSSSGWRAAPPARYRVLVVMTVPAILVCLALRCFLLCRCFGRGFLWAQGTNGWENTQRNISVWFVK